MGRTIIYRPSGVVESMNDLTEKKTLYWFPNGQLQSVTVQAPDESKLTQSVHKLMAAWDSTGHATVVDGTGYRTLRNEATSRKDSTVKTVFVEEGAYLNGLQHGSWKGYYTDGSYQYEEHYEQGKSLGGKAMSNGKEIVYRETMQLPEFEDGPKGLYTFLGQNIRYPADAARKGISGKVYLTFTICTDGSLCDFELLKGVHPSIDEEALRVAKKMNTHWQPGVQRGEPIRIKYNLPVSFQLE